MNKKFSTLLTMGLLMAGSLFSMANAQTNAKLLNLTDPDSYPAAELNKYYYIGLTTGAHYLTLNEVVNTDVTDQSTVKGKKYYSLKGVAVAALAAENDDALFKITVSKAGIQDVFTLTSKSGKTVQFKATASPGAATTTVIAAADDAEAVGSYFSSIAVVNFDADGEKLIPFHAGANANTNEFKLAAATFTIESGGTDLVLYSVDEKEMTAAALNELGNGTFSLTYKDATVTPFDGEMKAFEVSGIPGVDNGTYLATSWAGLSTITTKAEFQKCTFIALDSYKNWSINDLKAIGEGYKFTTVSGKKLMEDAELNDMKKGFVDATNAAFVVTEKDPVNAPGSYTLSLASASFMNAEKKAKVTASDLVIAAVADQEDLIVTSVTAGNDNMAGFTTTCTLANSNLISVDKLLSTKAASVFNIQFQSTVNGTPGDKTDSEYNKFLGINAAGMFAQGSDFVNLEAPENQWIIVAADKDDKTFTFQNRELTDQTFTVKLIATGKTANTYKVVEGTSAEFSYAYVDKEDGEYKITDKASSEIYLNGTTIKLIAAEVNPMAGYVTNELDNAGLVRFVFTSDQPTIANELFVAAGDAATTNLVVSKDAVDAMKWSVVKFDASADELDALVSDTIYAYNDFAYYDAAKREVKVETAGDTIAVVAYGFKQYGADKTYLGVSTDKLNVAADVEDAADAQRFLIKINKNGSYSLIEVPTAEIDYRTIVEATTKAFTVDAAAKVENSTGTSIYYDYEGITYNFSIAKDEPTPSLAHKPAYVTLNADNKGYVAMDSVNFDGIVAPVSLLKSAYTSDELTFRLDTADSEAYVPSFYISHIGKFMYNAKDSAEYYNDGTASAEGNKMYKLVDDNAKAIFRAATLVSPDTLTTTVNGKEAKVAVEESKGVLAGLKNFKYQIVQATADSEGEYVVKSVNDGYYLYNLNGFLGFTPEVAKALVVTVEQSEAPVANEAVTTSSVKVIAGNGVVTVIGAQGKKVTISNVLGQTIANTVLSSDNATINVPAGIVIVAIEGEAAVKAIVK
ncbi:MAG: DUF6383 domain-containing protein [Parabacteroides gordonii]|uniref:DUF6383 domain-containing protein n=1 Tax=Parabacteroides gordonii TaxID=574930 RepID=UPI003A84D9E3